MGTISLEMGYLKQMELTLYFASLSKQIRSKAFDVSNVYLINIRMIKLQLSERKDTRSCWRSEYMGVMPECCLHGIDISSLPTSQGAW